MLAFRQRRTLGLILSAIAVAVIAAPYTVSDDLPGPTAHIETIPAGSLVIPMDNTLQAIGAPFNIKAYGLVNRLLQNGIPVKWAIAAGKSKDGVDFSGTARQVQPTAGAAASLSFAGGPFVVHRDYAQLALAQATAFAGNVAVYQLTAPANVDVRYDLSFKPKIAINTVNSTIDTTLFTAAGIPDYTVVNVADLVAPPLDGNACYTIFAEPHTNITTGVANVKAYVQSGGNFIAQCEALLTYENDPAGGFQTTGGIVVNNISNLLSYPNPDLAFSQFVGPLEPAPAGSVQDWSLNVASTFRNNAHLHADNVGAATPTYAASAAKLANSAGGMVFYLGGHDYQVGATISFINGERMILNTVFVPSVKCSADFSTALKTISGKIYEDVNGTGSVAGGVIRPNVNVRLYADLNNNGVVDAGDTFLVEQPTDAAGAYSFQVSTLASGNNYLVAVDSKSVTPSGGFNAGFAQGDVWAEQTYGDNPATAVLDAGPRFSGRTGDVSDNYNLADTTPANNSYEHVARVDASSGSVPGVHFGFSFNVVTGIRGSGTTDDDLTANRTVQGSLRQFLQNANAIVGANTMRFVPAVAANAGTWWRINITTALPAISDANTTIDGQAYDNTNGTTVLDPNAGTAGAGGTAGVDALPLAALNKPELEVQDLRSTAVVNLGLDVQASTTTIRRLAINGFGAAGNSDASANIRVGAGGANALIEQNIIGTTAGAFADPGAANRSAGDDVRIVGAPNTTVQNNAIGFSGGNGVGLNANATGAQILTNEIRGNGLASANFGGISVGAGSTSVVQGNLIAANAGAGLDVANGAGANTIVNNTFAGNGVGVGGVTAGIRLLGSPDTIDRNIITASGGPGVLVGSAAQQIAITKNSIFANGGIGIDLLSAADNQSAGTAPFVTLNDPGDVDVGGNGLLNFPVMTGAYIAGSNLTVTGFARPGSVIELFVADPDASQFGEGKTYLLTLTEGSAQDTDTTTGTYTNPVNSANQGTDTTNRFTFKIPTPGGVTVGSILTATATLTGATSEFSGDVTVTYAGTISGFVYADANLNLQRDSSETGTGLTLYVKMVNAATPGGPATAVAVVDPATGAYSLPNVAPATYTLLLDDNNTLTDVTSTIPSGWTGTEMPTGVRTPVAVSQVTIPNQNFGLYPGVLIMGHVFNDNGASGGIANDGILNGGEPGIASVVVKLTDTTGATIYATATTDAAGAYALPLPSSIAAGTQLKIVETNANGFGSTGASVGNTGGTYDRATDTITFTLAANTSYSGVDFGDTAPTALNTDGQQSGLPGTTIFYAHTFTAATAGTVTFSITSTPSPALTGWTSTLYRDVNANGQLDPGDPAITAPIAVNAGDVVALVIKEFIPTNAPFGAKDQIKLTANFAFGGATPPPNITLTRQDVTTVGNPTVAGLTLSKSVDKPNAAPGATITYTINYSNTSSDVLRNVIIYDTTPAFTTFASGSNGPLPLDLTSVNFTSPAVGQRGAMRWTFAGTLRPGGSGMVTFRVTLDQ